jgi:predicted nucleic acid-binding protein
MRDVLVDAGPLVALLHRTDALNARVRAILAACRGRIYTTWPALTEAAHIAGRADRRFALIDMVHAGALLIAELGHDDFAALAWFHEKYRDRDPDLADLSLIVAAERHGIRTLLTFDRDFLIYRTRKGRALDCPLLALR